MAKQIKPNSFWTPVKSNTKSNYTLKPVKFFDSKPRSLKYKSSISTSSIPNSYNFGRPPTPSKYSPKLKDVAFYKPLLEKQRNKKDLTCEKAKFKYPKLNPYGDADKDRVPNFLDCRPFDRKRHIVLKYAKFTPKATKETTEKFFRDNPKLREEAERLGPKMVTWKIQKFGNVNKSSGTISGLHKVDFREDKKGPPTVVVNPNTNELPKRLKEALESKKEIEEKIKLSKMNENKPQPRGTTIVLEDTIAGKQSELPRLLQGAYAGDILNNLKDNDKKLISQGLKEKRDVIRKMAKEKEIPVYDVKSKKEIPEKLKKFTELGIFEVRRSGNEDKIISVGLKKGESKFLASQGIKRKEQIKMLDHLQDNPEVAEELLFKGGLTERQEEEMEKENEAAELEELEEARKADRDNEDALIEMSDKEDREKPSKNWKLSDENFDMQDLD